MAELSPCDREGDYSLGFAGDTFNTAWYLAQMSNGAAGLSVSYFTAVGDDEVSDDLRSFIEAAGIDCAYISRLPGETLGLYLIRLNDGERSFLYWRGQSAAKRLAEDRIGLDQAIADADLIYFSGITLAILDDEGRTTLLASCAKAREAGKIIAFDPNLRPALWSSLQLMTKSVGAAAAGSDIVLPSYEDEASWFGDASPQATLDRYAGLGVGHIVVKDGANSVHYKDADERGEVRVEPVGNIVDTTAAGDSFNAAVLVAVLNGERIKLGVENGCKLAAQVVQHRGALVQTNAAPQQPSRAG